MVVDVRGSKLPNYGDGDPISYLIKFECSSNGNYFFEGYVSKGKNMESCNTIL